MYEPTKRYYNVAKRRRVKHLTVPRALITELIRRYCWISTDCTILEAQKLGWFIDRGLNDLSHDNPMKLDFEAQYHGPYSHRLTRLLESLDGSYLRCSKRLPDATPGEFIWFDKKRSEELANYILGMDQHYRDALDWASEIIKGFESAYGLELLASTDWLIKAKGIEPTTEAIMGGLRAWPAGTQSSQRKAGLFDPEEVGTALEQLTSVGRIAYA